MQKNEILICTNVAEKLFDLNDYETLTITYSKLNENITVKYTKTEEILIPLFTTSPTPLTPPITLTDRERGKPCKTPQKHQGQAKKKSFARVPNAINKFSAAQVADFYLRYKKGVAKEILAKEAGINANTIYQWASVITRTLHELPVITKSPRLKEAAEYIKTNRLL